MKTGVRKAQAPPARAFSTSLRSTHAWSVPPPLPARESPDFGELERRAHFGHRLENLKAPAASPQPSGARPLQVPAGGAPAGGGTLQPVQPTRDKNLFRSLVEREITGRLSRSSRREFEEREARHDAEQRFEQGRPADPLSHVRQEIDRRFGAYPPAVIAADAARPPARRRRRRARIAHIEDPP